jgi:hypothetical protein
MVKAVDFLQVKTWLLLSSCFKQNGIGILLRLVFSVFEKGISRSI